MMKQKSSRAQWLWGCLIDLSVCPHPEMQELNPSTIGPPETHTTTQTFNSMHRWHTNETHRLHIFQRWFLSRVPWLDEDEFSFCLRALFLSENKFLSFALSHTFLGAGVWQWYAPPLCRSISSSSSFQSLLATTFQRQKNASQQKLNAPLWLPLALIYSCFL